METNAEEITIEMMRNMIARVKQLDEAKDKLADEMKELNATISAAKTKILQALQATNQDKFVASGIGTASIKKQVSVTTPKEIEERKALWQYIEAKYGADAPWLKFNINSQSLNSFYKEELGAIDDELDRQLFKLPGAGEPQTFLDVSFRWK